jgi:hypothetical protein
MNEFYGLILGILGVWRITHLLVAEDGPFQFFARMRRFAVLRNAGFWGELLNCFYCLSLYVAVPFAWFLGDEWKARLLLWSALSGAAILLERATGPALPVYIEDPIETSEEVNHELLRANEKPDKTRS